MKKFNAALLYGVLRAFAFLPMPVLFVFSDLILFPLLYHVVRYRRKVVRQNLTGCFPEKSEKEIRQTERKFYRHFCDSFQETIKILGMSKADACKHMHFVNPEVVTGFAEKGQGVLLLLGHYGNWEYQTFMFLRMLDSGNQQGFGIYRPLKNYAFDELMKRIRGRFGGINVAKNDTFRTVVRLRRQNIAGVFGLVSDQSPSSANLHYWTQFLNRETSILTGPERMAKQTGFAVVYADVSKVARGCYQSEYFLITDKPNETAEFEITEQYARLMEKTILREPAYWLWTHKRWKHARPAASVQGEEAQV